MTFLPQAWQALRCNTGKKMILAGCLSLLQFLGFVFFYNRVPGVAAEIAVRAPGFFYYLKK
jgi:hypothetical protein